MVVTVGSEADASVTTAAPSSEPAMSFAAIATATLNAVPAVSDPSARLATVDPPSTTSSDSAPARSEEHTSELQSLMRTSYAVFCLKQKTLTHKHASTRTLPRQT